MQFIRSFGERLSSFYYDIFAREAVLAVGVNLHSYGFLAEKQPKPNIQKEAS